MRYLSPSTLAEAIEAIGQGATPLAGGTVLVPRLAQGTATPPTVLDLRQIEGLHAISEGQGGVQVGAMVTLARLAADPLPSSAAADRCLQQAALAVGNPNVRRAGTVGGNVALPTSDLHPALLVLQATIAVSAPGKPDRDLPAAILGDGGVPGGVLIRHVTIPAEPGRRSAHVKFAWRAASGITVVSVAAALRVQDGLIVATRLAAAGVRARPSALPRAQRLLIGQPPSDDLFARAAQTAGDELPFDLGVPPSEAYRRRLVAEGLRRVLAQVAGS